LLLAGANLVSVKAFGEFEFWFAMIKVVTIILMIIAGFGLIFFGIGNGGEAIGLSNLWAHGGFMPNGWIGFFFALSIVIGSDRKSTRLNSSHVSISYAVFCLKTN